MTRMYEYLFFFVGALPEGVLVLLGGRVIACYYPFLLSSKYYLTVKNQKLQTLLIADGKNRSKSTLTRPEDRDKLSLLGAVHYLLLAVLWTAALVMAVYIVLTDLLSISLADRAGLVRLHALLVGGYMMTFVVMLLLSWLDYGLGKRLFGE